MSDANIIEINGVEVNLEDAKAREDIGTINTQLGDIANKLNSGNIGNNVEPALMDMPRIYFSEGTLPTSKTATTLRFDYYSKTAEYHGWAEIKCQGNSSMSYPKKNFTIKLFKDKAKTQKLKIDFKGWGKQSKFVLKANWIDLTHARNVVSARIWGDIVKSRSSYANLPELLRTSPNQGAIDGFPIVVYGNGYYQGRYTLNIPKDKWMSNMDDTLNTHCILCGENYVSGCFRALPQINGSDWTDELHDVVPATIKTSWTNVIKFVMNSSDTEFKANLNNYIDVESTIDYLLYGIVSTGFDAFGKNQIYMTYDGTKWIASMYDMDSTWGLWWNGNQFVANNYAREEFQDFKDGQGNLLFIRLQSLFINEIKARYAELRQSIFTYPYLLNRFEEFVQICPQDVVKEDYASTTANNAYTGIPSKTTNNIQQIRTNISARLTYVDSYINGLAENKPCTAISLDKTALTFTSTATQTLVATLTPTNTTDKVIWRVSPTGICTVENGVVTPIKDGACTITATCGNKSATCNVTVSGVQATKPCTAISLNKSELTFTGGVTPDEVIDITKNTANGSLNRGSWGASQGYVFGDVNTNNSDTTSDFIPFTSRNTLTVTQPSTKYGSGIVAYDSNKKAISCYTVNNTWEKGDTSTDVELKDTSFNVKNPPENTAYVRICFNLTDLSNVVVTKKYSDNSTSQEKLIATLTPTDTTDELIWSVSPTGIVTVENGVVTPIKNGNCVITAKCGSKTTTCNVTVSGIVTHYTITNNLTNCSNSNSAQVIEENGNYTATITANKGCTLDTITVTMGGTDITNTSVSNGAITINSVTGNIIITANATKEIIEEVKDGYLYTDLNPDWSWMAHSGTSNTVGDNSYKGFECGDFFNNLFAFSTDLTSTTSVISAAIVTENDTDKSTCDNECISGARVASSNRNFFGIKLLSTKCTDQATFKTYIKNNPINVGFKLAEGYKSFAITSDKINNPKIDTTTATGFTSVNFAMSIPSDLVSPSTSMQHFSSFGIICGTSSYITSFSGNVIRFEQDGTFTIKISQDLLTSQDEAGLIAYVNKKPITIYYI